jgi:hypothetical protein
MKQLFFFVCTLFFLNARSQTPEILLENIKQNYAAEKIYLHYDKSNYVAGETIWFKAYIMDGLLPSAKSTVLTVELIDDTGFILQKKMLAVTGSVAIGEFELPKNIKQASYTVKAFTRTLMNFGFQNFYYHTLQIYNPTSILDNVKENNAITIDFLPEGGNFISSIKNTVAFKCTDMRGFPIAAEGNIVDISGKVLQKFKSTFNGMGKFDFVPKQGEQYFADCILNNLEKKKVPLPKVMNEGIGLNITRTSEKAMFNIDANSVINESLLPAYLLGVQENVVVFKAPLQQSANKIMAGEIPVSDLATGILQLTVFNSENKPLAERLLFVNSGDYIPNGKFNSAIVGLSPRAKNEYSFNLDDTIAGSFSVAVTEYDNENKKEDNIVSHFLLTDDIKGYVHEPAYFFESNDLEHIQNLDFVMLTNGWRKYSWNEILSNRFPSMAYKDPSYITLQGKAFDPSTGKPLANTELSIFVKTKDKKNDFLILETNNEGEILMSGMNFEDTATFTFQSNATNQRKVNTVFTTANLGSIFYSVKSITPKSYFELPSQSLKTKIINGYNFNKLNKSNGILLDEVIVRNKIKTEKEKYEKKNITGRMGGMAAKEIDFLTEPTTSAANIFDYLRSRLNGVNISGGPLNYSIIYRNARSLFGGPIQMNVFLDEMQIEPSQIATLRVQDVAIVRVFSAGGLSGGAGGSLAIYTKKGDGGSSSASVQHKNNYIEGFTPTKEFFSPNYSQNIESEIKTDERTTLYWNPFIITTPQNKLINFSFYNSDKAKKIKVVIEGFLEDGRLLRVEKIIE